MKSKRAFEITVLTISIIAWIFAAFLLVEIVFKVKGQYPVSGVVYDEKLGWRHKKNHYAKRSKNHSRKMDHFSYNSSGFRDREHHLLRSRNITRIIVLGDSYTVGGNLSDEDVFVRLFEKKLNKSRKDNVRYDVMNVAVSAWATDQQLLYLKQEGMKYKPDYVFLMIAPNDIRESYVKRFFYLNEDNLLQRSKITRIPWKKRFLWWLSNHFSTYQFIQQRVFRTDYGSFVNIFSYFPVGWDIGGSPSVDHPLFLKQIPPQVKEARYLFKALLLEMNKLCINNNCKLILVVLPTLMEFGEDFKDSLYEPGNIGKYVEGIAIEYDVAFLDLFPILRLEKGLLEKIFLPEDYHFDRDGHIFVAEKLYDFFAGSVAAGVF